MIKMVSSRVKTASEAYDAVSRIGESVKRANPKDKSESASSVRQINQRTAEGLRVRNARIERGSDRELRVAAPSVVHTTSASSTFSRSLRLQDQDRTRCVMGMTSPAPTSAVYKLAGKCAEIYNTPLSSPHKQHNKQCLPTLLLNPSEFSSASPLSPPLTLFQSDHWPTPLRQGYRRRDDWQSHWSYLLAAVWP